MIIDTRHLFISSAGCHHAERNSCKFTEIWKLHCGLGIPLKNASTPAMPNLMPTCGLVNFLLLCMCNTMTLVDFHVSNDTSVQN